MFTVQEFFTEKPKAALIADKIRTYENGAMTFFRAQFPRLADQLDDDQLREVVKLAYENAKKRGITTERDHWKYLIIVAFWGSHFETDPMYQVVLKKAGWFEDKFVYISGVVDEVKTRAELIERTRPNKTKYFKFLVEVLLDEKTKVLTSEALMSMQKIWPELYKYVPENQNRALIEQVAKIISECKIEAPHQLVYLHLSTVLGANFLNDPLYPWAIEILSDEASSSKEKMIRILKCATEYWG